MIRDVRGSDRDDLLAIRNPYIRGSHVTFETVELTIADGDAWLVPFLEERPGYRMRVEDESGRVVGWAASCPLKDRPGYRTSVETSVYVESSSAGRGLGRSLLADLLRILVDDPRLHRAYGLIALPNPASEALHRSLGYRPVGTLDEVGFKLGRYHDVRWYERSLDVDV